VVLGKFRPVNIRLAAQTLGEAIRAVLSSCDLPLDYLEKHSMSTAATLKSSNTMYSAGPGDDFANMVNSRIISRFYGAHAYDQSPIRMRRMARNTVW
jgi:hypothetical protein